jgi:hypothetical protein
MSGRQDLTAAAKNVIENYLDAPDLSPEMIARILNRHGVRSSSPHARSS